MEYPRCPSCNHELYDGSYRKCPFCGHGLSGRGVGGFHGSSSSSQFRIVILASALLVVLGGALGVYFAASTGQEETERTEARMSVDEAQLEQMCDENMYRILEAEAAYRAVNGSFTEMLDELQAIDESIPTLCPQSGRPYKLIIEGESVRVVCEVHGSQIREP
jgi:hypothetical protein